MDYSWAEAGIDYVTEECEVASSWLFLINVNKVDDFEWAYCVSWTSYLFDYFNLKYYYCRAIIDFAIAIN